MSDAVGALASAAGTAPEADLVASLESAVQAAIRMDAALNDRLAHVARNVRDLSPVFAEAVDRMVSRLQAQAAGASAPAVGEPLPHFLLPDDAGRLTSLTSLIADGPAVVSFVRGHWCPYCRLNTIGLAEIEDEIRILGATPVVIAPERRRFAKALKSEANAHFAILSDIDNGYALSLNLAIWVGAEMERLIAFAGWSVPAYYGSAAWFMPIPATFVVRQDGVISARYLDPDYRRRMDLDDLLEAIRQAR